MSTIAYLCGAAAYVAAAVKWYVIPAWRGDFGHASSCPCEKCRGK